MYPEKELMTRVEITALLGFKRTTFYMFKRLEGKFPPARGCRKHVPMYDLDEVAAFLFDHAPEYLTRTPDGMKLAAKIMKEKGIAN